MIVGQVVVKHVTYLMNGMVHVVVTPIAHGLWEMLVATRNLFSQGHRGLAVGRFSLPNINYVLTPVALQSTITKLLRRYTVLKSSSSEP